MARARMSETFLVGDDESAPSPCGQSPPIKTCASCSARAARREPRSIALKKTTACTIATLNNFGLKFRGGRRPIAARPWRDGAPAQGTKSPDRRNAYRGLFELKIAAVVYQPQP